jgi:hypothetical protein
MFKGWDYLTKVYLGLYKIINEIMAFKAKRCLCFISLIFNPAFLN